MRQSDADPGMHTGIPHEIPDGTVLPLPGYCTYTRGTGYPYCTRRVPVPALTGTRLSDTRFFSLES